MSENCHLRNGRVSFQHLFSCLRLQRHINCLIRNCMRKLNLIIWRSRMVCHRSLDSLLIFSPLGPPPPPSSHDLNPSCLLPSPLVVTMTSADFQRHSRNLSLPPHSRELRPPSRHSPNYHSPIKDVYSSRLS